MKTPIEDQWLASPWARDLASRPELYKIARDVFYAGAASAVLALQRAARDKDASARLCVELEVTAFAEGKEVRYSLNDRLTSSGIVTREG